MKVTYREALKSKGGGLPWVVRGKLFKGRPGTMRVSALFFMTAVLLVILLVVVGQGQLWRSLVGEGLDMTYTSNFIRVLVSWLTVIFATGVLVALVVVTWQEAGLEILDIERDLIARADEEIEL